MLLYLHPASGFHILVLDIQLTDGNGIELAKLLTQANPRCRILFVSGFIDYVSDVYEVPHVCLVLMDPLQMQYPLFLLRAAQEVTQFLQSAVLIQKLFRCLSNRLRLWSAEATSPLSI